jgi:hypothetical protein
MTPSIQGVGQISQFRDREDTLQATVTIENLSTILARVMES